MTLPNVLLFQAASNSPIFCKNGHMVCGSCKKQIQNCPTCRSEILTLKFNIMDQILDTVTFHCKFKNEGCSEILSFKKRENHENHCEFRSLECKYKFAGCTPMLKPKEKENHEKICEYRFSVQCQYKDYGCNEIVFEDTRENHENLCEFRLVYCYNHRCPWVGI